MASRIFRLLGVLAMLLLLVAPASAAPAAQSGTIYVLFNADTSPSASPMYSVNPYVYQGTFATCSTLGPSSLTTLHLLVDGVEAASVVCDGTIELGDLLGHSVSFTATNSASADPTFHLLIYGGDELGAPTPTPTVTTTPAPSCETVNAPADPGVFIINPGTPSEYASILWSDVVFAARIVPGVSTYEATVRTYYNAGAAVGEDHPRDVPVTIRSDRPYIDAYYYETVFSVAFCGLLPVATPTGTVTVTPTVGTPTVTGTPVIGCAGGTTIAVAESPSVTSILINPADTIFALGGTVQGDFAGSVTIPPWADFPVGLDAGSYISTDTNIDFWSTSRDFPADPAAVRICPPGSIGTPTLTATVSPSITSTAGATSTATQTATATSTSTASPSPTVTTTVPPTGTSTSTPTDEPTPTLPATCGTPGIEDEGECVIIEQQRTQIALQLTQIAQNNSPAPLSTPSPAAPTDGPNIGGAVATICAKDPCASAGAVAAGMGDVLTILQANSTAPNCADAWSDLPDTTGPWAMDMSGVAGPFCFVIDQTTSYREWFRTISVFFALAGLYAFYQLTMSRLGDQ